MRESSVCWIFTMWRHGKWFFQVWRKFAKKFCQFRLLNGILPCSFVLCLSFFYFFFLVHEHVVDVENLTSLELMILPKENRRWQFRGLISLTFVCLSDFLYSLFLRKLIHGKRKIDYLFTALRKIFLSNLPLKKVLLLGKCFVIVKNVSLCFCRILMYFFSVRDAEFEYLFHVFGERFFLSNLLSLCWDLWQR